jgi:hypothetical protein
MIHNLNSGCEYIFIIRYGQAFCFTLVEVNSKHGVTIQEFGLPLIAINSKDKREIQGKHVNFSLYFHCIMKQIS